MAHVLTYPEIVEASKNNSIIYEEVRLTDRIRPMKFDGVDFVSTESKKHYLLLMECDEEECMDYNYYYRCWNEKPTDEERDKTPWKGNPYEFLNGEK